MPIVWIVLSCTFQTRRVRTAPDPAPPTKRRRLVGVRAIHGSQGASNVLFDAPYPPIPATMFTVIAMMNTLKKNAITLCSKATRRR